MSEYTNYEMQYALAYMRKMIRQHFTLTHAQGEKLVIDRQIWGIRIVTDILGTSVYLVQPFTVSGPNGTRKDELVFLL